MPITPDPNRPAFVPEDNGVRQEGEVVIPPLKESDIQEEQGEQDPQEETPYKVFKTEEEYNTFISEQKKAAIPTTPTPKEPEKEEELVLYKGHKDPETGKWVGEAPADWNDFAKTLLTNPTARKILAKQMSKEVVSEIKNMSNAEKEEMDKINKEFDDEYNSLSKQGLLPDLSTKEGQAINKEISLVGATYGLTSITKAYDLWKKLPKEHGGGLGFSYKKADQDLRRQKAALIGGGRKVSGASADVPRKYEDIHKRSLDELVQERTKE